MQLPQRISRLALFAFGAVVLIISSRTRAQVAFNPEDLRFGEVVAGSAETLAVTMTNNRTSSLTISTATVSASAYKVKGLSLPVTLAAGQSVSFEVKFSPTATGVDNGSVAFNGGAISLTLHGSGISTTSLSANPASVAFGNVGTQSRAKKWVTLINASKNSVTISQQTTAGAGLEVTGLSLPLTLAAGASFTFAFTFSPTATGEVAGVFKALNSANQTLLRIPLGGTGIKPGDLTVSPASVHFGEVSVGENSTVTGSLSATGAVVTVSSATSSNSQFVVSGITLPTTIAAGQSLPFSVIFTPQSAGADSATLTFASNASNSPPPESLQGTGVMQYSVSLSWDASTSKVKGYNVYRSRQSGGPYNKLNSSLDSSTSYTDSTVAPSRTYYYVTTAVNSSGQESGYSNQVEVAIP